MKEFYQKKVVPQLKKEFGYKNNLMVPSLKKVVINIGLGQGLRDPKFNEAAENTLKRISGQQPVKTRAKKAISAFKIRKGMVVGLKVTLRGARMYDFVYKLINITLPRVRDFRGLSADLIDQQGNLSIGFKENIVFPEVKSDELDKIHGLEVSIETTAKNKAEGLALLKYLGFQFKSAV